MTNTLLVGFNRQLAYPPLIRPNGGIRMSSKTLGVFIGILFLAVLLLFSGAPLRAQNAESGPEVIRAAHHDVSRPLREIEPAIPRALLPALPPPPPHPPTPISSQ